MPSARGYASAIFHPTLRYACAGLMECHAFGMPPPPPTVNCQLSTVNCYLSLNNTKGASRPHISFLFTKNSHLIEVRVRLVDQPGFEPRQTVPKTVVLPLHHWSLSFEAAKIQLFLINISLGKIFFIFFDESIKKGCLSSLFFFGFNPSIIPDE